MEMMGIYEGRRLLKGFAESKNMSVFVRTCGNRDVCPTARSQITPHSYFGCENYPAVGPFQGLLAKLTGIEP